MLLSLTSIAILHWAVLVIPGFNFVLIGQLAAAGQRRGALSAVAGMTTATLVWASLSVVGIGMVFSAHHGLRHLAQIAGGAYLIQLAFKLWRSGRRPAVGAPLVPSSAAAFRIGFVTSALNPKIALFYSSVFATALPANPSTLHVVLAVLLVYVNSLVWHLSLALLLSRASVQRAYWRHHQALNRASGALIGIFGVQLIASAFSGA
jgi:threonine/homoserine/homoserine lactone efflux protein